MSFVLDYEDKLPANVLRHKANTVGMQIKLSRPSYYRIFLCCHLPQIQSFIL